MTTVGSQRKGSQASRIGSTVTSKSAPTSGQPARAKSVATMPSSGHGSRSTGPGNGASYPSGKKLQTEVWDPFQFDCVAPGNVASSKDLLHAINEERRRWQPASNDNSSANPCCRPAPAPPCPAMQYPGQHQQQRNSCDSGESDSQSSAENGRRTAEFLYEMWCQQKLCDVMLRCCGEGNTEDTILAHKVGLCLSTSKILPACLLANPDVNGLIRPTQ